jgi:hypothetical protein
MMCVASLRRQCLSSLRTLSPANLPPRDSNNHSRHTTICNNSQLRSLTPTHRRTDARAHPRHFTPPLHHDHLHRHVWDLPTLELKTTIHKVHTSKRTVSISKWIDTQGVLGVHVTPTATISCGVDGTVKTFSNLS